MMYEDLVADFARRTRTNLEGLRTIKRQNPNMEVYEVTQLINSMLGLLVFPQQRYIDRIPQTPLEELTADGWPIPKVTGDYPQAEDLQKLVRLLRNGISHFNIEFIPDTQGEISALSIWNTEPRPPHRVTWKAELSIDDLERITSRFTALLLNEKNDQ
jgi:hypothetical protein